MSFTETMNTLITQKLPLTGPDGSIGPKDFRDMFNSVVAEVQKNSDYKALFKARGTKLSAIDMAPGSYPAYVNTHAAGNSPNIAVSGDTAYFVWYEINSDSTPVYTSFIASYDLKEKRIKQGPTTIFFGGDIHFLPQVRVLADGYVLVTVENDHNDSTRIFRSVGAGDISSFTNTQTLVSGSGGLTRGYESLHQDSEGRVLMVHRSQSSGAASNNFNAVNAYLSTNGYNGYTRVGNKNIAELDLTDRRWCYPGMSTVGPDKDWVCVYINVTVKDPDPDVLDATYLLFSHASTNFEVWGNIAYYESNRASGWSKNIETGSSITETELATNALIDSLTNNGALSAAHIRHVSIGGDGKVGVLFQDYNAATTTANHKLAVRENGAWVFRDIIGVFTASKVSATWKYSYPNYYAWLNTINQKEHHLYHSNFHGRGNREIRRYVTFDSGRTWMLDLVVAQEEGVDFTNFYNDPNYLDTEGEAFYLCYKNDGVANVSLRIGELSLTPDPTTLRKLDNREEFYFAGTTTDGSAAELFIDQIDKKLELPEGYWEFEAKFIALRDNNAAMLAGTRKGVIKNIAGTTALVGAVQTIGTDINEGSNAYSIAFTADNTNDALVCSVTGTAAHTVKWRVEVTMKQIAN